MPELFASSNTACEWGIGKECFLTLNLVVVLCRFRFTKRLSIREDGDEIPWEGLDVSECFPALPRGGEGGFGIPQHRPSLDTLQVDESGMIEKP